MLRFECDYGEGAAPAVLELLQKTNFDQTPGYGEDEYCAKLPRRSSAVRRSRRRRTLFRRRDPGESDRHCGGAQAVAGRAVRRLRAHPCARDRLHRATGHKCLALPGKNGKITARQIRKAVEEHRANASHEHEVQPGMVYISNPTEVGTLYNKEELTDISAACYELGLYLFVDGARMAYGLTSPANDLSLQD